MAGKKTVARINALFAKDVIEAFTEFRRTGRKKDLADRIEDALDDRQYYRILAPDADPGEAARLLGQYAIEVRKRAVRRELADLAER